MLNSNKKIFKTPIRPLIVSSSFSSNNFKNDSEVDDWKNKNSETSIKEITTGVNRGALNLMKKPKKAGLYPSATKH